MKRSLITALRMLLFMTLLTGILYPGIMTLLAQLVFPHEANGSLIIENGTVVGSALLGQDFAGDRYFHSRPSAIAWNPLPSGATNWGPTDARLADSAAAREQHFRRENHLADSVGVPPEMLFASASGVDPHISPEAAMLQVDRVVLARHFDGAGAVRLRDLVRAHTEGPQYGLFGPPRVNVLLLNIALDEGFRP